MQNGSFTRKGPLLSEQVRTDPSVPTSLDRQGQGSSPGEIKMFKGIIRLWEGIFIPLVDLTAIKISEDQLVMIRGVTNPPT